MITPLIIIITGLLWSFPLIAAQVVVPDPQWHPNNVGDWGILGECITFWDSCINRYNPACPDILCATCTELSPFINNCCAGSDQEQENCLPGGSAYLTATGSAFPSFSSIPSAVIASSSSVSANADGCASAAAFWEHCSAATSSFFMLPASVQSSCICVTPAFQSGYDTQFHLDATSCYDYLTISAPSQAAGYSSALLGFCAENQEAGSPPAVTATPTSTEGGASATPSSTLNTPKSTTTNSLASKASFKYVALMLSVLVPLLA